MWYVSVLLMLESLHLQKEALELSSRKVAAISGDARRALDICRRSAELAESWGVQKVGLKEIDAAIQEMFASSKVKAITDCSVYEQLFLRAVLAELIRIGLEEAQLDKCVRQMDLICRCEGELPGFDAHLNMHLRTSTSGRCLLGE